MARSVLFFLPALVFAWAELLEQKLSPLALRRLYAGAFAAVASIGLAAALVDYRYAGVQKEFAREIFRQYGGAPRTVWFVAHHGLRHYLLEAGGRELDFERGGWDQVKPGDVVVRAATNKKAPAVAQRFLANVRRLRVELPIPLRLISGFGGEGGFYSSVYGFLPYSASLEPVEEFELIERL